MSGSSNTKRSGLKVAAVLGTAAVLSMVGASLFGSRGVVRHERLRTELGRTRALNHDLALQNEKLRLEVEALKSDPGYIEMVVRDRLGYVRADEMVLIFRSEEAKAE